MYCVHVDFTPGLKEKIWIRFEPRRRWSGYKVGKMLKNWQEISEGLWFPCVLLSSNLGEALVEYTEEITQLAIPWTWQVSNETGMCPVGTWLLNSTQKVCCLFLIQRKQQNVWADLKTSLFNLQVPVRFHPFLKHCEDVSRTSPNLSHHSALVLKFLWDVTSLFNFLSQLDFSCNFIDVKSYAIKIFWLCSL